MVSGKPPFYQKNREKMFSDIIEVYLDFLRKFLTCFIKKQLVFPSTISKELIGLLKSLLSIAVYLNKKMKNIQ